MKTAHYGVLGDGAGTLSGFDSWQERAAYQYCKTLENLDEQGFVMTQPETEDYTSLNSSLTGWAESFQTWLENMPDAPEDEVTPRGLPAVQDTTFPSIISQIVALAVTGAAGGVPAIIANVAIQVGLSVFEKWLAGKIYAGESGNFSDVAEALNNIYELLINENELSVFWKDESKDSVFVADDVDQENTPIKKTITEYIKDVMLGIPNTMHITINNKDTTEETQWSIVDES